MEMAIRISCYSQSLENIADYKGIGYNEKGCNKFQV